MDNPDSTHHGRNNMTQNENDPSTGPRDRVDAAGTAVDLLRENERLKNRLDFMERQINILPKTIQDKLSVLNDEINVLHREKAAVSEELGRLKDELQVTLEENREFAEKYVNSEKRNSNLTSLYVASYQLHSTLNQQEVLGLINEIIINFIGGEKFALYLFDKKSNSFTLASGEDLGAPIGLKVPVGDNLVSRVAHGGGVLIGDSLKAAGGDEEAPMAGLPLSSGAELVGVLLIYRLLVQKDGFESVDMEMFDMLSGHAATALLSSDLYSRSLRKASTLQGFFQILKDKDPHAPQIDD